MVYYQMKIKTVMVWKGKKMLRLMQVFIDYTDRKDNEHFSHSEQVIAPICREMINGRQGNWKSTP